MGLLNSLFSSTEAAAQRIKSDEADIIKHWQDYTSTIPKKKELIGKITSGTEIQKALKELIKLLQLELVDISGEEKEEGQLISELEKVEHSQKIKRIHRLERCLAYAETKYEYVYHLLHQLHSILKSQMHIANMLAAGSKKTEKLISHLKQQLELELETIKKIEQIETFHNLFIALAKGEHIIRKMDAKEKKLLKKMQEELAKIFSNQIDSGITYEWAMEVYNAVEDIIMDEEAVIARGYDLHQDIEFQFVNGPKFVELAKENIQRLKKRKVSERMINVFVHLFREWYNYGRD